MDADKEIVEAALAPVMAAPLIAIVRAYRWVDVTIAADMRIDDGIWLGGWVMRDAIEYGLDEHIDAMRVAIHDYIIAAEDPAPFKAAIAAGLGDEKVMSWLFTQHMEEKNYAAGAAMWNLITMIYSSRGGTHVDMIMIYMGARKASFEVSREWMWP